MNYVPNGSGLFVPENLFNTKRFSVSDGVGYTPRGSSCKHTGFNPVDDKLIFPDIPPNWTVTAGSYWTAPPYHTHTDVNSSVSAYMPGVSTAIGDQWCAANITQLLPARYIPGVQSNGIGIGVMTRFIPGTSGFYGIAGVDTGGNQILEIGTYVQGSSQDIAAVRTAAGVWSLASAPFILLLTTGTGGGIAVKLYAGKMSDFVNNTLTLYLSFHPGTFLNDTGMPGANASSGGDGVNFGDANQTNWIAGIIGGC